jgi:acid phosphatase type 7
MKTRLAAILAAVVFLSSCSGSPSAPSPPPSGSFEQPPTFGSNAVAVLVGAGDIGDCKQPGSALTARLLDGISGTVFTAGDNAYPNGSDDDFRKCYDPTWGRHRDRTRPSPGNHEYDSPQAAPYFRYFGGNAGPPGLGYYSYNAGAWHVVSLNSEIDMSSSSAQVRWLRADLTANRTKCTVAYWHKPLFSSGPHGNNVRVQDLWRALYDHDVDVVVTGHDHLYERFAPQNPDGGYDAARGIRQLVVGTGGSHLSSVLIQRPNSEAVGHVWGVLALTLNPDSYRWEFVPAEVGRFVDVGTGTCH